ncbi:hypothetical protein GCM10009765_24330 [Fodinicola feengrottensis]|uniref:Uncharacterized protein n=1 Tax=Fodinicola feengrottensis TaxID=435914 RepID=A0ABN2GPV6_9ACTN
MGTPAGGSTGGAAADPPAAPHPTSGKPAAAHPGVDDRTLTGAPATGPDVTLGNSPTSAPSSPAPDPPPSQYVTQPTRHVDARHGSVTFTYQNGQMGVQDPQPESGYSATITKLQARKAIVQFTNPDTDTTETVLAQVSDTGSWVVDLTEAS